MPRDDRSTGVALTPSLVLIVSVSAVFPEMIKVLPAADPVVILTRYGVADWARAEDVHPALVQVIVFEVIEAITPVPVPFTTVLLISGNETIVAFLTVPVPAAIVTVTAPTGTVVTV